MSEEAIEAMVERAAQRGAASALHQIGLGDDLAGADIRELRGVLDAWRVVKHAALVGTAQFVSKAVLYTVLIFVFSAVGIKTGILQRLIGN